ncbi:hypothetical protein EVB81_108 [Rhizobium phage RHph_I46]|uniref:Uncharacterized protein n=1 Tax=Rhizobium phage RHph_I1_9 TaxID=2509729 RepID=A0A7S5RJD7_9CAUD|nr:hypothetical protein PP936_gp107 [Rhizobium phage RHph_I1_9]QIG69677.1 hypothetical protein EVB81_108 [Rhizobium phage RHph_I46]QIG70958.1 hypothetical protein EVB92_108 [Rhizobium phage RHph_I9]QIG73544.1 hypothetical protein EVC04_107 [Rhizobium phage RHph_I1_9]QIG76297.1 hypothetical protein EVC25_108 [Rhizobium phage RHph_I34]
MDIEAYLKANYFSRDVAEKAMHDFSVLKRRLRKYGRGTNDAMSIYNLIVGLENEFESAFIDHILSTRFSVDERRIYSSCLRVKRDFRMKEFDSHFLVRLEKDYYRIRHG